MNIVAHITASFHKRSLVGNTRCKLYNGEIPLSFKSQTIKEERSSVNGMSNSVLLTKLRFRFTRFV